MKKLQSEAQTLVTPKTPFTVVSADLSLRRPGFCVLRVSESGDIECETFNVDQKKEKATRGQILHRIYNAFVDLINNYVGHDLSLRDVFFVREKAFNSRGANSEIGIFEVVGITDFILEDTLSGLVWDELYPVTVKKLVTGNGKASKEEVATALTRYIGPREYACDDESDAAAVAIAWLIQHDVIQTKGAIS